ncbi:MAG: hypothetical protein ACRBBR_14430 [Cellvibrionaceae bacterium]
MNLFTPLGEISGGELFGIEGLILSGEAALHGNDKTRQGLARYCRGRSAIELD